MAWKVFKGGWSGWSLGAVIALSLTFPTGVEAEPLYDSVDCRESDNLEDWAEGSNVIYYYVDSSFAIDLNSCADEASISHPEDNLTQMEARSSIQAAAETWNRESYGPALIYASDVEASNPEDFCNNTTLKPAVWVHFVHGCRNVSPEDAFCDTSQPLAEVRLIDSRCTVRAA